MPTRILIFEDDPLVAMMIEGFLDALGYEAMGQVTCVTDALHRITAPDFDAAIVDVHLADGEVDKPVTAALQRAGIPFLLTSGAPTAREAGMEAAPFLLKPFSIAVLEETLAKLP